MLPLQLKLMPAMSVCQGLKIKEGNRKVEEHIMCKQIETAISCANQQANFLAKPNDYLVLLHA